MKDHIPRDKRSGVVYSVPCKDCSFTYVGETGIHLSSRIKQHKDAVRKGDVEKSAHVWELHHSIDWDNTTIVDFDPETISRKTREALYIRRRKDLMNRDLGLETSHIWDSLLPT